MHYVCEKVQSMHYVCEKVQSMHNICEKVQTMHYVSDKVPNSLPKLVGGSLCIPGYSAKSSFKLALPVKTQITASSMQGHENLKDFSN